MTTTSPRADERRIFPFIPIDWGDKEEHFRFLAEAIRDSYRIYHRVQPTNVQTVSATYSMQTGDLAVLVDTGTQAVTVYLPSAEGREGQKSTVKLLTAGNVNALVIHGKSTQTIDGSVSLTISTQYAGRTVLSDGSNWHIVGSF